MQRELDRLLRTVSERLRYVRSVFLEPGLALTASSEAVLAKILEVRRSPEGVGEIIIDAGFPELPQIGTFAHRIFLWREGKPRLSRPGRGRILGNTCLEYDVLGQGIDLDACSVGDMVAIADAGAYDASMSFRFARGRRCS